MRYRLLVDYPGVPKGSLVEPDLQQPHIYRGVGKDFWVAKDVVEVSLNFEPEDAVAVEPLTDVVAEVIAELESGKPVSEELLAKLKASNEKEGDKASGGDVAVVTP